MTRLRIVIQFSELQGGEVCMCHLFRSKIVSSFSVYLNSSIKKKSEN